MIPLPGFGIVKGMALTLKKFFEPKATIRYPEVRLDVPPKFRGRLQLLYDEWGTLKCETCFQCAQACPIECIDMGGVDTRGRYHVHWGPPETYGERRDESALRRSGRTVPDRNYEHFGEIDLAAVDAILDEHDFDPKKLLPILEGVQEAYGYLPVAAVKHISFRTGAWYAFIYGTATYYRHLRFVPPADQIGTAAFDAARPAEQRYVNVLAAALAGQPAPDRARDLDDALAGPAQNKPRPRRGSGKVH
jgi:ferredoxin